VALESGAPGARLVDDASEIDPGWLEGVTAVGLSSGASVPEILVREVLGWLAARGYRDLELVRTAQETVRFALPPELRGRAAARA
jgi:4-hydroxy-3-methylbut-2-enyl diphosphate reductase